MNGATDNVPLLAEFNTAELLNLLGEGAYITDLDRRIVFWNTAAEQITGWNSAEVVGRSCRDNILVHVDKDGVQLCGHDQCPLHRSIVTGNRSAEPLLVFAQHKDGHRVPVEVMVAPVRNHAGAVIGGVELFRDMTMAIEDQLRAKRIQEISMSCELPADDRLRFEILYQPRDLVGGDIYRVEKLGNGSYGAIVADARGHGVAAALYTMQLRSLWDEHRTDLEFPSRFMDIANRQLRALVWDEGYFGTAVYITYDADSGQVRCVRAGHPAPLLFRLDGEVESVGASSAALGLFPNPVYRESMAQLNPGDMLLLFSDGATEVAGHGDSDLDPEGLIRLVRAQTQDSGPAALDLETLQQQLLEYSNQIRLDDDLTLVKLVRTE